jgi:hypothetical protein
MSAIAKSAGVAAVLALSVLAVAANATAQSTPVNFKPNQGVSLHLGQKHAVGYFLTDNGLCQLTLVVGDEIKGDELPATVSARFRATVEAGKTARFDTGSGTELRFTCTPGAVAMTVEPLKQVAYSGAHLQK